MEKFELSMSLSDGWLRIEQRKLRLNYLRSIDSIIADVGQNNTYLTLVSSQKQWVSTIELESYSFKELAELVKLIAEISVCKNIALDKRGYGLGLYDELLLILKDKDKLSLIL